MKRVVELAVVREVVALAVALRKTFFLAQNVWLITKAFCLSHPWYLIDLGKDDVGRQENEVEQEQNGDQHDEFELLPEVGVCVEQGCVRRKSREERNLTFSDFWREFNAGKILIVEIEIWPRVQ